MKSDASKVIPIINPVSAAVHHATVLSVSDQALIIEVGGIAEPAITAFSCLVQPQQGDIVMVSRHESGSNYVLGIMQRPDGSDMTISLPGATTLKTNSGSLSILSSHSINMLAAEKINCISDQVIHKSREAIIDYNEVTARGDNLQASYSNIRVFSELMSTMAKQVIDRFKSYIRHSENSDQVKAGQMTREVSGLYSMDTKYTIMVSKKDTKIDGERIHMG